MIFSPFIVLRLYPSACPLNEIKSNHMKCQADEAYKYVQKFIDKNREWSDSTFGNQSAVSVLKHLRSEVKEAIAAIENHEGEYAIDMEFADMYLLLLNACSRQGISFAHLHESAISKMQLNRDRKWGEPNSEGFVTHIEEGEKLLSSRDYVESVYGTQHFAITVDCRDAESLLDLMDEFADQVRREDR